LIKIKDKSKKIKVPQYGSIWPQKNNSKKFYECFTPLPIAIGTPKGGLRRGDFRTPFRGQGVKKGRGVKKAGSDKEVK